MVLGPGGRDPQALPDDPEHAAVRNAHPLPRRLSPGTSPLHGKDFVIIDFEGEPADRSASDA